MPRIPRSFFPPSTSMETASYRSRHASRHVGHARAAMHIGIDNPQQRGKRSRHSRCMRKPEFYASGKRPIPQWPTTGRKYIGTSTFCNDIMWGTYTRPKWYFSRKLLCQGLRKCTTGNSTIMLGRTAASVMIHDFLKLAILGWGEM